MSKAAARVAPMSAREELLAGAQPTGQTALRAGQLERTPTGQLVEQAEAVNASTTARLKATAELMEQTKQMGQDVRHELADQHEQVKRMNHRVDEMKREVTYAEKLLKYMNRWCCCWCCFTDPEDQKRQQRQEDAHHAGGGRQDHRPAAKGSAGGARAATPAPGPGLRDPHISLPEDYGDAEQRMQAQVREQRVLIDKIEASAADLRRLAGDIARDIDRNQEAEDKLADNVDVAAFMVKKANNHELLRR